MNRRAFLHRAVLSAVALRTNALARRTFAVRSRAGAADPAMTEQLLNLVNAERASAGLTSLKLDSLACTVAEKHAMEMASLKFLSHWGIDGGKPYHRYSFAGGVEAIHENDASMNSSVPLDLDDVAGYLISLHKSMHDEAPPHDGHRQTILNPWHTHVGFGYAGYGYAVRLCEVYVARYVLIDPHPSTMSPRDQFLFSGRVLDQRDVILSVDVFYEPLPKPPELAWLRTPRPYGLPDERQTLMPKLGPNTFYQDGSKGSLELLGRGRFRVPIVLSRKQPGIYTIVVWLQRAFSEAAFPATNVCIRAE